MNNRQQERGITYEAVNSGVRKYTPEGKELSEFHFFKDFMKVVE